MTVVSQVAPLVDLRPHIRPGDSLIWGQGASEPRALTEAVVAQRASLGPLRVFLGASYSETLKPEHADHIAFTGIGGIGTNGPLARAQSLDVVPCHVSAIPSLISEGRIPVDVVLIQVSPVGPSGCHSLGLAADWLGAAMDAARIVIAEVNDRVPYTRGDVLVRPDEIDVVVHSSRDPVQLAPAEASGTDRQIAERVAALVPDGATLQLGVGSVAPVVAEGLWAKHDIGLHCGVIGDWFVALDQSGAVTNRYKGIDTSCAVTASLAGGADLYTYVHDNPRLELRPVSYTHDPRVLSALHDLVAVNSAIEVDITGQVNAETVGGIHIGAVGGQVDFVRAAMISGRSIIALASTAKGGSISRIVPRLSDGVVTTPRSDADLVVTEHGVADLRGVTLPERSRRLIAVADPSFRPWLEEELHRMGHPC